LDPIVGAICDIGWLAVHVACNDVATAGIRPRWLLLLVLVPRVEDEELLEQIMRDASRAAGGRSVRASSEDTLDIRSASRGPWCPLRRLAPPRAVSRC
jgi:hydrogenase maturation factor